MKCPHCLVAFHPIDNFYDLGKDVDGNWIMAKIECPTCARFILILGNSMATIWDPVNDCLINEDKINWLFARPKVYTRDLCPQEVPNGIKEDYLEACLVLADSPKASAALSRRCLQNLLIDAESVKQKNLYDQIQEVIDSGKLPSQIAEAIDAVRNIGNFAAHPIKSKNTGEIVQVEPEEAEWNLDVLEALFDFYYVQPAKLQSKRDELNKKLKDSGKPPMK